MWESADYLKERAHLRWLSPECSTLKAQPFQSKTMPCPRRLLSGLCPDGNLPKLPTHKELVSTVVGMRGEGPSQAHIALSWGLLPTKLFGSHDFLA